MLCVDEIVGLETLEGLADDEALDAIALLVDHAFLHANLELTAKALAWGDMLEVRTSLLGTQRALLDYYRANAWSNRLPSAQADSATVWAWDQEDLQQQLLFLRRATSNPAFEDLHVIRQCQILTNLANQLDTVGRFVEAQGLWSETLRRLPAFWMARCNRGRGLMHYAYALHDPGHKALFVLIAHHELTQGVRDLDRHPDYGDSSLRPIFSNAMQSIAQHYDLAHIEAHLGGVDGGEDIQGYRLWCLQETLYLNPLNDLGPHPIAARDVLSLPDFVAPIGEPPVLIGLFNQLKQEFVSARWLYFEGSNADEVHPSDRDVLLYNTLDYPAFGLAVEKVKISFRMAYSLLDKIAYFLNHYLKLGIPEKRISFRSIWRAKDGDPVREQFTTSENWSFRGMYWLSKDLFEDNFRQVAEPAARELNDLRNHLEHKYVKVHIMGPFNRSSDPTKSDLFFDTLAHSLSADDLQRRTLYLLKLARSALIYLSLGMHKEEERRRAAMGPDALIPPMPIGEWDDDWKRW